MNACEVYHHTMEQAFENRIRHLRCTHQIQHVPSGPAHCIVWTAHLSITTADSRQLVTSSSVFSKRKEAVRQVMTQGLALLQGVKDPCDKTMTAVDAWRASKQPMVLFQPPPASWFADAQVLGIDFEGSPPALVQLACREGVYVDRVSSPTAQAILQDARHKHCVFGEHEMDMVACPCNLQTDKKQSLVELVSITLCPAIRVIKDKTIHARVDWTNAAAQQTLCDEAAEYAAADAYLTRKLAVKMHTGAK
jgi:hypothetical protein